jgi:hypothetical protein
MSLLIILLTLAILGGIGTVWLATECHKLYNKNRTLRNKIVNLDSELRTWRANCLTLEASNKRYEEFAKGREVIQEKLKPIPMSESSTDRWRKVNLE